MIGDHLSDHEPEAISHDGISVVIPTHTGRQDLVIRLLESLRGGRCEGRCAVPDPRNRRRAGHAGPDHGRQLPRKRRRIHPWAAGGRSQAKRRRSSRRHPVLLFIDSDCRATSDLLQRQHWEAHRDTPDVVVAIAGPTLMYGEITRVWRNPGRLVRVQPVLLLAADIQQGRLGHHVEPLDRDRCIPSGQAGRVPYRHLHPGRR